MKHKLNFMAAFLTMLMSCNSKGQPGANTNGGVFNDEDVSGVFNDMPPNLSHTTHIASRNEPGERIKVSGIVYESDGKTPANNVQMYFYHTNSKGIYAKRESDEKNSFAWWHGYNRGWLKTNERGEYEINTIKPAPYPAHVEPAHIHVVVKSPTQNRIYEIGAITFKGDELATPEYWYAVEQNGHPRDGGTGLKQNAQGILEGQRDFVLYAQYDNSSTNSGLLVGEECPAFTPDHAFGHDKGSKACPMCKYGSKQGVMAWVNTDSLSEMEALTRFLEKKISEQGVENMRAFIIFMNPSGLPSPAVGIKLNEFAMNNRLKNVALLHVPSPTDNKTSGIYRLNPHKEVKNTIFVYKARRVAEKFINLNLRAGNFEAVNESINKTILQ